MWIQTPTLTITKVDQNEIHLSLKKESAFAQIINSFDDFCVDHISKKSTDFFNGKRFSKEKIQSVYQRTLQIADDGDYNLIAKVHDSKNLFIRDQRNIHRSYDDIKPGYETICILDWEGIAFKKKSMNIVCSIQQMKLYINEGLKNWSIEQDSDEEEDDDEIVDDQEIEAQMKSLDEIAAFVHSTNPDIKDEKNVTSPLLNSDSHSETLPLQIDPLNDDDQDLF